MTKNVNRLYKDLAWLWPIWEDVEVYRQESQLFAKLIKKHAQIKVRSLLDMGCGGGKNAYHLKRHFVVTGIDKSQAMLASAKKQNPDCKFEAADIRNFDLKQQFDSVFINDSITYMTTKRDLLRALQGAYNHLKVGGIMIIHPDECKERFRQNETTVWTSKTDDMDITFIENQYDPNPDDDTFEKTLIYLIRKDGKLRIEHDFHICGLFALDVWRKSLEKVGFEVFEDGESKNIGDFPVFVCVKSI